MKRGESHRGSGLALAAFLALMFLALFGSAARVSAQCSERVSNGTDLFCVPAWDGAISDCQVVEFCYDCQGAQCFLV